MVCLGEDGRTYGLLVGPQDMKQMKGRKEIMVEVRAWRIQRGTRFRRCHLGLGRSLGGVMRGAIFFDGIEVRLEEECVKVGKDEE